MTFPEINPRLYVKQSFGSFGFAAEKIIVGKSNRLPSRIGRRRAGVAMLELAIVLPIFLLLLLGIIEMGRVMMLNQITTNSAREGARLAVVPGATQARVLAAVNSYLDAGGVSAIRRVVSVRNSSGSEVSVEQIPSKTPVTILVQVPYSNNTWGITTIMGGRTLNSRSTMRRE